MGERKDIDEHEDGEELGAADQALIDLLYGEVVGDARARAEAALQAGDLAGDLERLREVRGLFAELPDDEPPAAVTAKLLHAAAAEAPRRREPDRAGLWARLLAWFHDTASYPGLAAVATMVVVAGVAGTMWLRGSLTVVEPEVTTSDPAAVERSGAGASPAAEAAAPGTAVGAEGSVATGELDTAPALEDDRTGAPSAEPAVPERPRAAAPADRPAEPRRSRPAKQAPAREESASNRRDDARPRSKKAPASGGVVGGVVESIPIETSPPEPRAEPAPATRSGRGQGAPAGPPASPPAPVPAPDTAAGADDDRDTEDERATLRSLLGQARKAAAAGDCASVRSIGARVRKLDRTFFEQQFVRDAALAPCYAAK